MPIEKINIKDFVLKLDKTCLFDVRSPSEYNHAHIPGAILLPIFSDDERRIVGTLYKQESREKAIKIGLEIFGKNCSAIRIRRQYFTSKYNRVERNNHLLLERRNAKFCDGLAF